MMSLSTTDCWPNLRRDGGNNVIVHLIDGTYELFRQHFGRPAPGPYGAVAGVIRSTMTLIENGATHIGVATDHVIESFRNDLWAGYKTSEGMDPAILLQIPVLADALEAVGVTVWRGVEVEADDLLASAAALANADDRVERVMICTADKDLGQCVRGSRVVQLDRRNDVVIDEDGVVAKFGVAPLSIPDWLGLVGDTADGFPGLPGWGAKTASAVLARYGHIEQIPDEPGQWDVPGLRGAAKLAATLHEQRELAELFKVIATCVTDCEVGTVDSWRWNGPTAQWAAMAETIGAQRVRIPGHG
jgi:5'-3' exonuclease